jgi:LmbE family N-acetylglucosaminyl deacetylase
MIWLQPKTTSRLRILALGAHADDIEIGCGGTLLTILRERPDSIVRWVVFSGHGERATEARTSAALWLTNAQEAVVDVHSFRDGFFPYYGATIKEAFEDLKSFTPDLVFSHYRDDRHQDHREISNLTWNTFRNHLVLEYEIPKYDGDLSTPNVYVPLDQSLVEQKCRWLQQAFPSQASKDWFSDETFLALARLRGLECHSPGLYAEAFYGRKLLMSL